MAISAMQFSVLRIAEGLVLSKAEGLRSPHPQVSPQCAATSMMSTIANSFRPIAS
jgi:hypothetical protein